MQVTGFRTEDPATLPNLAAERAPGAEHRHPAIFECAVDAADHYGDKVMAAVLSGGDGDGAEGLRYVHERGGTALVQQPSDAGQPSMPLQAIMADHRDAVLPVEGLPECVRAFCGDRRSR